jgi:hypothetical protein
MTLANTSPVVSTLEVSPQVVPKEKVEHRVSFFQDGQLFETVVSSNGRLQFAASSQAGLRDSVRNGDIRIEPPHNLKTLWETEVLRFPSRPSPYGSTVRLLEEIRQLLGRYVDASDEWLDIICLYILMTWVYDRFTALPYLRFLGETSTGKTRFLQVCSAICYKATVASGNITGAALFRTTHLVRGTMAVDEADFKNSAEWSDITKILNNGYIVGTPVIRCNKLDFSPEAFHVFGPKIISTRHRFEDEATETRCLTLETRERTTPLPSHIPLQLPTSFNNEALDLRNKLLQWRFDNFQGVSAREENLRTISPRAGQIGASLAAVAPNDEWHERLVSFIARSDVSRREDSPKSIVLSSSAGRREWGFHSGRKADSR